MTRVHRVQLSPRVWVVTSANLRRVALIDATGHIVDRYRFAHGIQHLTRRGVRLMHARVRVGQSQRRQTALMMITRSSRQTSHLRIMTIQVTKPALQRGSTIHVPSLVRLKKTTITNTGRIRIRPTTGESWLRYGLTRRFQLKLVS
jgi:hypothetical protein